MNFSTRSVLSNIFTFGSNLAAQLGIGYDIGNSTEEVNVKFPIIPSSDKTIENETKRKSNKKQSNENKTSVDDKTNEEKSNEEKKEIKIVKIKCGTLHTLALSDENVLYSWGCNDEKALGRRGDEEYPDVVELVPSEFRKKMNSEDLEVVDFGCGQSTSFVLTKGGLLFGWGLFRDASGPIGFFKREGKSPVNTRTKLLVDKSHVLIRY